MAPLRGVRLKRPSVRLPIALLATVLVLVVTLTVLWNVVLVHDYNQLRELAGGGSFHWTFIVLGSLLFIAITVVSTILGIRLISNVRWSQRQSNFLASVSHELNSPITSVKLFAQTLRRKDLSPEDRARFTGKILVDTERMARIVANIVRAAEVDHRGEHLTVAPSRVDLMAYLRGYKATCAAAADSGWRTSLRNGDVRLRVGGKELSLRATKLTDAAEIERVTAAFREKYGFGDTLATLIRGEPTIFRLTPR